MIWLHAVSSIALFEKGPSRKIIILKLSTLWLAELNWCVTGSRYGVGFLINVDARVF